MTCSHSREGKEWVDEDRDYEGYVIDGYWKRVTVQTTIDLDLHRYKCTQCGKIMYYSTTAKEYHEDGKI